MTEEKKQEPVKSGKNQVERDKSGRFVKGSSGNLEGAGAGRPKGAISIITEIKKQLDEMPEDEKKNNLKIIVSKMIEMAKIGDDKMIKHILNYVEGLPKQSLELGVDNSVEEVSITIKGKDEIEHTGDNNSGEELGGTPEGNKDN